MQAMGLTLGVLLLGLLLRLVHGLGLRLMLWLGCRSRRGIICGLRRPQDLLQHDKRRWSRGFRGQTAGLLDERSNRVEKEQES